MSTRISKETLIGRAGSRLLVGGVLAVACLAWPLPAQAVGPRSTLVRDDGSLSADGMVHEALIAELQGRNRDRDRWIQEALKDSPDHRRAHWLDGQVLVNRRWIRVDESPSLWAGDNHHQEYLRVRSKYADTVPDQLRLGDWCAQRQLTEQARRTLHGVIQLEPDHAAARKRLGYRRIGEQWYTAAEFRQVERRLKELTKDYAQWKPQGR